GRAAAAPHLPRRPAQRRRPHPGPHGRDLAARHRPAADAEGLSLQPAPALSLEGSRARGLGPRAGDRHAERRDHDGRSQGPPSREPGPGAEVGTRAVGYPFFDESIYHDYGVPVNEPLGVGEISRSGKFLIPSTNSTNLTVHSWFRAQPVHTRWEDQPRPADPRKTYVAFLISDGDNVGYVEGSLRTRHFDDPARGSIPMGVSISPWLQGYAPQ